MKHFGQNNLSRGAKIPSNDEWNDLNNSMGNINLGDNNWMPSHVSEEGITLPYDAFFFPHVAQVDFGLTDAIIGPQREDEEYPYLDSIAVPYIVETNQLVLVDNKFEYQGVGDTDTSYSAVLFQTASETTPTAPADVDDATIVGYQWNLAPEVIDVTFADDGESMQVTMQWSALTDFDSDAQASVYDTDSGVDAGAWAMKSGNGTTTTPYEDLINKYLDSEGEDNVILSDDANDPIANKEYKIPIAAYNWNLEGTELERVIQLYFGGSAPAASGSALIGDPYIFRHPHRGTIDDYTVTIGAGRSNATYKFKDSITITDPDSDIMVKVEYDTPETIELDSGSTTEYYVFYDLYKNGSQWESTLSKSTIWPPTVAVGNVAKLIGYAASSDSTYSWGQEMFDCPNEQIGPILGEFEPFYELDGSVTIADGYADNFNNNLAFVQGKTISLSTNTEVWVEVASTESAGDPDVTVNSSLQTGTFPGMFKSVSSEVKNFNYKIGEVASGVYVPAHKGRLQIDATLLTPDLDSRFTSADQTPRLMAFDDSQVTSVGSTDNDLLLKGIFVEPEIVGGNIQKIEEGNEVKIYGLTETPSDISIFDEIDTSSSDLITFKGFTLETDFDHGLAQDFDTSGSLSDVPISADGKWIGIEPGGIFKHKTSPVASTDDADHWFTTGALQIAGSTDTMELYFDKKGHLWKYNDTVAPPPDDNYRYRHCSDPTTYPDLIFASQQANTVIRVSDQCYEEQGETEEEATDPAPTVDDEFETCAACDSSLNLEQWKWCDDDTDGPKFGVLAAPTYDFAWVCDTGTWRKGYYDRMVAGVADDPSFLLPCDVVPTECADLVGFPADDNWSGSGCNVGSIGDNNDVAKWDHSVFIGAGSFAVVGGKLRQQVDAGDGSFNDRHSASNAPSSGDHTMKVDLTLISSEANTGVSQGWGLLAKDGAHSSVCRIYCEKSGADANNQWIIQDQGGALITNFAGTSISFRIIRVGSTFTPYYNTGGGWVAGNSVSSSAAIVPDLRAFSRSTTTDFIIDYDNFTFVDGSSAVIIIDPTGQACT